MNIVNGIGQFCPPLTFDTMSFEAHFTFVHALALVRALPQVTMWKVLDFVEAKRKRPSTQAKRHRLSILFSSLNNSTTLDFIKNYFLLSLENSS